MTYRRSAALAVVTALGLSLTATPAVAEPTSATRVSAHLTPSTVHVGAVFAVTGTTKPVIKSSTVVIERLVGKTWTRLGKAKTTPKGSYALNLRAPKTAARWTVRVVRASSAKVGAGASVPLHLTVTKALYVVTASAPATTVSPAPVVVSGTVAPKATGVVVLQLLQGKAWHAIASGHLSAASSFAISTVRPLGSYRLRVVKAFSAKVAGGVSKTVTAAVAAPVVVPPAPAIAPVQLAGAEVGRPYTQALTATGGTAPLVWSATSLPGGLTMSTAGLISGRPTGVGTSTVVITVLDAIGRSATTSLPLVVAVASGTVKAWGAGTNGELGNGSATDSNVPVAVSGLTLVTAVASATYSEYALRSDGTVWSWGHNQFGQLGTGATSGDVLTPMQIPSLAGVTAIAGGGESAAALKADGTVWAWGQGTSGELGNGAGTDSSTPVQVSGLTGVVAIALSDDDGYALKADGTVWAWGEGNDGELGDGASTSDALVPLKITSLSAVTAIAGAADSAYALVGGTVMAWGHNSQGELGNGSTTAGRTPALIAGLTGVTAISAGYFDGYALHADGSLSAWGKNSSGELGNGLTTTTRLPVTVPGLTGLSAVQGRASDVSVLKTDGTVMAWGYNGYGGLGNGTTTDSDSPVAVPALTGVMSLPVGPDSITALAIIAQ
ncbi:hypothetical protein acdb102_29790 [Acidothermaceae bacterium B102]|nr:hypothetical protein acdb102_29790 [Acidothermaceae bacterium B102]